MSGMQEGMELRSCPCGTAGHHDRQVPHQIDKWGCGMTYLDGSPGDCQPECFENMGKMSEEIEAKDKRIDDLEKLVEGCSSRNITDHDRIAELETEVENYKALVDDKIENARKMYAENSRMQEALEEANMAFELQDDSAAGHTIIKQAIQQTVDAKPTGEGDENRS